MTYSIIGATTRHTCPVGMERRLAAILNADVQGYSRLMHEDETATIRTLTAYRGLMASLIRQYRGRVVDDPGDNLLAEFPSVVEAVQCAVTIQRTLAARNAALPPHRQMVFRMGLHLGDIVVEQERIYGAAVNLAARLERVAEGGGLCISGTVYDHVVAKLPLDYSAIGVWVGQGTPAPVRVYRVEIEHRQPGHPYGVPVHPHAYGVAAGQAYGPHCPALPRTVHRPVDGGIQPPRALGDPLCQAPPWSGLHTWITSGSGHWKIVRISSRVNVGKGRVCVPVCRTSSVASATAVPMR